ncbi:MAG: sugar ABC transporter permease [Acidimicrobiia bacterium]|nr:sugar ABC transporter permease [Acidimicrobiia bacterium]
MTDDRDRTDAVQPDDAGAVPADVLAEQADHPTIPAATPGTSQPTGFGDYFTLWTERLRAGELGALPIGLGLLVIFITFGILDDTFYTARNFTNLLLQMTVFATIAIGVVFVLLIAEIDLSVAFVSAVGGVVMTLLLRPDDPGWPAWAAIAVALLITTTIGWLQGIVITKAGVPSFVVTLAGLLIWSGVVLVLTTSASQVGTIRIQDDFVVGILNAFLSDQAGWALAAAVILGFAGVNSWTAFRRRRDGLPSKPTSVIVIQTVALAVVTIGAVWYANSDRGVPRATVFLIVFLLFWSFVASKLRFGRHVYAIGGNPEAARRAGINVDRVRIMVFMIMGFMAGVGGIMAASRLRSVSTAAGGGNLLLLVIASAVIGGTSLFGGQGRVISALLGALIITSIENGMNLLGLASGTKFIITGLVLLGAVLIDAWAKKRRTAVGVG